MTLCLGSDPGRLHEIYFLSILFLVLGSLETGYLNRQQFNLTTFLRV